MLTKKTKVFFPRHCLTDNSGFIVGWKIERENICVAVAIISRSLNSNDLPTNLKRIFDLSSENDSVSLSVLGIWLNEHHEESEILASVQTRETLLTEGMIIVRQSRNDRVPQIYFLGDKLRLSGSVIVLYTQPSGNAFLTTSETRVNSSKFWVQSLYQEQVPSTELSEVLNLLNKSRREEDRIITSVVNKDDLPSCSSDNFFFSLVLTAMMKACGLFSQRSTGKHSIVAEIVKFMSSLSAVISQCCVRFSQVKALCLCVTQSTSLKGEQDLNLSESRSSPQQANGRKEMHDVFPVVWFGSLVTALFIDVILGILIVLWIFTNDFNIHATGFLMEKTDTVVEFLSALLDWLKGAPAGLKLNKQLAEYLSTFFLYHIYLWQIYLSCIEPYLQIIMSLIIMSGCFGVTFLLSLISELLSVITLHIYCFYVYAARLYNFQLKKLITLFRLFTGEVRRVENGVELSGVKWSKEEKS